MTWKMIVLLLKTYTYINVSTHPDFIDWLKTHVFLGQIFGRRKVCVSQESNELLMSRSRRRFQKKWFSFMLWFTRTWFRTQRSLFQILLNETEIGLYLPCTDWFRTKRTLSVCCSKSIGTAIQSIGTANTTWFQFDLIRIRKYFSVYSTVHQKTLLPKKSRIKMANFSCSKLKINPGSLVHKLGRKHDI